MGPILETGKVWPKSLGSLLRSPRLSTHSRSRNRLVLTKSISGGVYYGTHTRDWQSLAEKSRESFEIKSHWCH